VFGGQRHRRWTGRTRVQAIECSPAVHGTLITVSDEWHPTPSNHTNRRAGVRENLARALPLAPRDIARVIDQHCAFLAGKPGAEARSGLAGRIGRVSGGKGGTWQSLTATSQADLARLREPDMQKISPTLRVDRLVVGVPFARYLVWDPECDQAGEQARFHLCNLDGAGTKWGRRPATWTGNLQPFSLIQLPCCAAAPSLRIQLPCQPAITSSSRPVPRTRQSWAAAAADRAPAAWPAA